jgi:hypothetical protein
MIVRVYGTELENAGLPVLRFLGKDWPVMANRCAKCEYVFFCPLLPEHEPTFCPNCGCRFNCIVGIHEPAPLESR